MELKLLQVSCEKYTSSLSGSTRTNPEQWPPDRSLCAASLTSLMGPVEFCWNAAMMVLRSLPQLIAMTARS